MKLRDVLQGIWIVWGIWVLTEALGCAFLYDAKQCSVWACAVVVLIAPTVLAIVCTITTTCDEDLT